MAQAGGWGGDYLIPKSTFLKKKDTKFCFEDTLQNPKIYTEANKYKTCV